METYHCFQLLLIVLVLEFVFLESPKNHLIIGLEALLHDLSVCLNVGNPLIYLLEYGQFLILIIDNTLQLAYLRSIFLILTNQLSEHVLVLVHLVNEWLTQLRHQGTRLGSQIKP